MKKETQYDYFINIGALQTKGNFGAKYQIYPRFNNGRQNSNEVTIEIYDVNNLAVIYSQKAIGIAVSQKNNHDIYLSKSSRSLLIHSYKKLIKDINKKSLH